MSRSQLISRYLKATAPAPTLGLTALFVLLTASQATAQQSDVFLQLPNAALLVDTSGSMELKTLTGVEEAPSFPTCNPGDGSALNETSRFIDLNVVLTGSVVDPRCEAVDRTTAAFASEFSIGTVLPDDYNFENPYHRILSGTCGPGPHPDATTELQVTPYAWPQGLLGPSGEPETWLRFHELGQPNVLCSSFTQQPDGLLDTFRDRVRFALMTFDGRDSAATGVNAGDGSADFNAGVGGLWSYFVGPDPATGLPGGCLYDQVLEVGARNMYAPPWEGRMVPYAAVDADESEIRTTNEQIQQVLLSTRPYGSTPIAALMSDSRDYHFNETALHPADATRDLGPRSDPYVVGGCRPMINILLTDGEPNKELRPFCEEAGGVCPFPHAYETAREMYSGALGSSVKTFVIGFALPSLSESDPVSASSCSELTDADLTTGACSDLDAVSDALRTCCILNRIAFEGGTERAQFAANKAELRQALSGALSTIVNKTTRTTPVVSASGAAAGSRVWSEFIPERFNLWQGVLQRERWACVDQQAEAQEVEVGAGDDFARNLNNAGPTVRNISTVIGDYAGGLIHSTRTIRPKLPSPADGIDSYVGEQRWGGSTDVSWIPAAAMGVTANDCDEISDDGCRDLLMRWTLGTNDVGDGLTAHRCPSGGGSECSLFGAIYHSTPTIVEGVPSAGIPSPTYDRFVQEMLTSERPPTLYTSTNDGFFHGFDMSVETLSNNEFFAFIPPAVLPSIQTQYPGVHRQLLDGIPIIRDVPATRSGSDITLGRTLGASEDINATWRTIAVQGFGSSQGGYFAMDVTNPERGVPGSGPEFLWQLTTSAGDTPLFGSIGSTPLITTVFINDGTTPAEVPVAVLPGGNAAPIPGPCPARSIEGHLASQVPSEQIQCYGSTPADYGAMSLTIVRLDTGEILQTFRHEQDLAAETIFSSSVYQKSTLRSPLTGQPVAYPGRVGAVADRIFVGDRDGTLWRVDVSSPDPTEWSMNIFWDAYASAGSVDDRQPILTQPVLSVNNTGEVTVAFSTGDQEVISASTGMENFVWSLTESRSGTQIQADLNWVQSFDNGDRVTGPMAIHNKGLYFSTFAPQEAGGPNPCDLGTSRIWGLHYTNAQADGTGAPFLPQDPAAPDPDHLVQFLEADQIVDSSAASRAVIFGVTVSQTPSCESATESVDLGSFYGYSNQSFASIPSVNKGQTTLNFNAGSERGSITLPPASQPTFMKSWVHLTE